MRILQNESDEREEEKEDVYVGGEGQSPRGQSDQSVNLNLVECLAKAQQPNKLATTATNLI